MCGEKKAANLSIPLVVHAQYGDWRYSSYKVVNVGVNFYCIWSLPHMFSFVLFWFFAGYALSEQSFSNFCASLV